MVLQVVTANRLADGEVVYLGSDGQWLADLEAAAMVEAGPAADAILANAEGQQLEIVGPYLIDVCDGAGGRELTNVRERIRASGPSVRIDHGKQAGN